VLNNPIPINRRFLYPLDAVSFFTKNTRVVDPYSFFPDPDPEYDVGDQYGSGSNTDPGL
jgi:hypothetical protein